MNVGECGLRADVTKSRDGQTVFTKVWCTKLCGRRYIQDSKTSPLNPQIPLDELQSMADEALEGPRQACIARYGLPAKK